MALHARDRGDVVPILLASAREASGADGAVLWRLAPTPTVEGRAGEISREEADRLSRIVHGVLLDGRAAEDGRWRILPLRMEERVTGALAVRGARAEALEGWGDWIPIARRLVEERMTWEDREALLADLLTTRERPFSERLVRTIERLFGLDPVILLDPEGKVVAAAGVDRNEAIRLTETLFETSALERGRFRALGPGGDLRALYFLPLRSGTGAGGTLWALGPLEAPYDSVMRSLTEAVRAFEARR